MERVIPIGWPGLIGFSHWSVTGPVGLPRVQISCLFSLRVDRSSLETIVTFAFKMAASMSSEFWRRINELKIQLQSLNRIEGFQGNDEESHGKNIVKPKILSRWAFTCTKMLLWKYCKLIVFQLNKLTWVWVCPLIVRKTVLAEILKACFE